MTTLKNITLRFLFIYLFAHLHVCVSAQDSSRLRISLLTCTPGEELYSIFGHSALRVIDSNSVTDHVYNYGTFDFEAEGFYLKFLKGQLKYYVSLENFKDFKNNYIAENRGITEQVFDLPAQEKINIRHALKENLKEENKYYLYNFFLDNCTTRLRDIIVKNHSPAPVLPAVMPAGSTFRDGLHKYLDLSHSPWTKFGMDLLLSAPTDEIMTPAQQQFLPDNLMYALDSAKNEKLVSASQNLFNINKPGAKQTLVTPFISFISLLILFVLLSLSKNNIVHRILHGLDGFLFFTVGLLGVIFVIMWTATDHYMMRNNYNLLWAWPTHLLYAFFMHRNTKRVKTYSLITAIFLLLLLCAWFFVEQQLNPALIPVVLLMIYRSGVRGSGPVNREGAETLSS